ncbi:hypothetical protein [Microbacterium sp. C7(2022)]|nr:hypothetical protein [Microbacterium sp. C7(2022)]MDE0545365.1 hypothetical protein [Microbacterium sp. C7(2022)]
MNRTAKVTVWAATGVVILGLLGLTALAVPGVLPTPAGVTGSSTSLPMTG